MVFFQKQYRQYVLWILLVAASIALGLLLRKHPAITLPVSALPFLHIMSSLYIGTIYAHQVFYIFVSAVLFVGNLYELIYVDREKGKRQTFWGAGIFGVFGIALSFAAMLVSSYAKGMYEKFLAGEMSDEEVEFIKKLKTMAPSDSGVVDALEEINSVASRIPMYIELADKVDRYAEMAFCKKT